MILSVLIILKTMLYMNITNIEYNKLIILLFTALVSMIIISIIEFSKMKDKRKKRGQIIFYTLFSVITFADIMYYSYFQALPSISVMGQAKQLSSVTEMVFMYLSIKNLLLIIDLPIVIYYILKKEKREVKTNTRIKILSGLIGVLAILSIYVVKTDKFPALRNQELYTYHVMDIVDTYFKDTSIGDEELEQIKAIKEKTIENGNPEGKEYTGIAKDRNLIVIQVESLQNFVINLDYNGQEVTPHINELIKEQGTIYFDEYFQLVGRGNTSDAEFVTNNSIHPSMEEFTYAQYPENTYYGLPWLLGDEGYNSWVFHGFEKEFWNREEAYPNQGFERFISDEDYDYEEEIGFGISDHDFYEQSLEYMKELDDIDDDPFYSFLISLSSHTPYTMEEEYQVLDIEEDHKDNIVGDYLQAVHYADKELGKFIEDLKEEGLYDNSVIAFYGDHFGVANSMPEVFGPMEDILEEPYNFDHVMNIPLVIHVPGEEINETVSKVGSQIDFFPTILNIMGYSNNKGLMMGQDMLNSEEYNFVPTQTIMRKGSFIDDDIIFNIAQDGMFEHSSAADRDTREEVELEAYRENYDKAISEINISDFILKEDLFKKLKEADWNIDQMDLTSERLEVPDQRKIDVFEDYTMEDLDQAYGKRNQIMRIDIDKNTDLDALESWMMENKEAHLILKTEEGFELLEKVKDDYPELKDRYIGEMKSTEHYFELQRHGYENLILNIINSGYTDEEIIDFLNMNKHYGVIMNRDRGNTDLTNKLDAIGVKAYIEKEDELKLVN